MYLKRSQYSTTVEANLLPNNNIALTIYRQPENQKRFFRKEVMKIAIVDENGTTRSSELKYKLGRIYYDIIMELNSVVTQPSGIDIKGKQVDLVVVTEDMVKEHKYLIRSLVFSTTIQLQKYFANSLLINDHNPLCSINEVCEETPVLLWNYFYNETKFHDFQLRYTDKTLTVKELFEKYYQMRIEKYIY